MHDYVIKKFLLIVGGFCILKRIHFVSPCQPLAIRQEDMVVLSYDGFLHAKSEVVMISIAFVWQQVLP